jgi:hypothetical protein
MLKYLKAFNRTLISSKGLEVTECIYSIACLLPSFILVSIGKYFSYDNIYYIGILLCIIGFMFFVVSIWNMFRDDINDFVKKVKNNIM